MIIDLRAENAIAVVLLFIAIGTILGPVIDRSAGFFMVRQYSPFPNAGKSLNQL
jgi:hypothetical protein